MYMHMNSKKRTAHLSNSFIHSVIRGVLNYDVGSFFDGVAAACVASLLDLADQLIPSVAKHQITSVRRFQHHSTGFAQFVVLTMSCSVSCHWATRRGG